MGFCADSVGAIEENRVRANCCSCWGGTDSGIPLLYMLFLLDLSSRSAILSLIQVIFSVWALLASSKELNETCTSFWHCLILDTKSETKEALSDSIMSFNMVSDTGWPVVGKAAMGLSLVGPVLSLEACNPLTSMPVSSWYLGGESLKGLDLIRL